MHKFDEEDIEHIIKLLKSGKQVKNSRIRLFNEEEFFTEFIRKSKNIHSINPDFINNKSRKLNRNKEEI